MESIRDLYLAAGQYLTTPQMAVHPGMMQTPPYMGMQDPRFAVSLLPLVVKSSSSMQSRFNMDYCQNMVQNVPQCCTNDFDLPRKFFLIANLGL